MNKNYTLKELSNIGLNAACQFEPNSKFPLSFQNYREAFVKAILDAIGYELPKDEEREAFDVWWKENRIAYCNEEHAFQLWKAGREELRKAGCSAQCEDTQNGTRMDSVAWQYKVSDYWAANKIRD